MNVSSLFLAISDSDTTIYTNSVLSVPQSGIIQIEDEVIRYEFASDSSFVRCTRGYNDTTAVAHAKTTPIDFVSEIPNPELFNGKVISEGAEDSGDEGFRVLQVPN